MAPLPRSYFGVKVARGRPRKDGLPPRLNQKANRHAHLKRAAIMLRMGIQSIEEAKRNLDEALQNMNGE